MDGGGRGVTFGSPPGTLGGGGRLTWRSSGSGTAAAAAAALMGGGGGRLSDSGVGSAAVEGVAMLMGAAMGGWLGGLGERRVDVLAGHRSVWIALPGPCALLSSYRCVGFPAPSSLGRDALGVCTLPNCSDPWTPHNPAAGASPQGPTHATGGPQKQQSAAAGER